MELQPVDPNDDLQVERYARVEHAVTAHDAPWMPVRPSSRIAANLRWGWDLDPEQAFLLIEDGDVIGTAGYHVSRWDNPAVAYVDVAVLPPLRRRGHGSTAMAALVQRARAESCRTLILHAWEDSGGTEFAQEHGFTWASQAILRRQRPQELDRTTLQGLVDRAAPRAAGYVFERYAGTTPEAIMPELAVVAASINDSPLDDLDLDDEDYSPERMRAHETAIEHRGDTEYRVIARHRGTGRIAGHTVVVVESERPDHGHQEDTAVDRDHRGHRLGLLLKADMLQWLAEVEPGLQTVDTWNAESNDHMIAVNEALGYRAVARSHHYQLRL